MTARVSFSSPRILQAHCYAFSCRRERDWSRFLASAPVYTCGGCGTTREFHDIVLVAATSTRPAVERRNDRRETILAGAITHGPKNQSTTIRGGAHPRCGCCGAVCRIRKDVLTRPCGCDPHSAGCPHCGRRACHCVCRSTKLNFN